MSKSKALLKELKEDVDLQDINGGSCTWYDVYSETMNAMYSCHMGRLCGESDNSGSSGGRGHPCASISG
ncbi:hypothetical protein [Salibacterium halotolerans]|uniref:hypothetical protein n=1 Tax=Salibacterium halotolerans TaxID=1884432 RepID=UPI0011146073|nr:hypothetical protein [Salibacterium halotolerans]